MLKRLVTQHANYVLNEIATVIDWIVFYFSCGSSTSLWNVTALQHEISPETQDDIISLMFNVHWLFIFLLVGPSRADWCAFAEIFSSSRQGCPRDQHLTRAVLPRLQGHQGCGVMISWDKLWRTLVANLSGTGLLQHDWWHFYVHTIQWFTCTSSSLIIGFGNTAISPTRPFLVHLFVLVLCLAIPDSLMFASVEFPSRNLIFKSFMAIFRQKIHWNARKFDLADGKHPVKWLLETLSVGEGIAAALWSWLDDLIPGEVPLPAAINATESWLHW